MDRKGPGQCAPAVGFPLGLAWVCLGFAWGVVVCGPAWLRNPLLGRALSLYSAASGHEDSPFVPPCLPVPCSSGPTPRLVPVLETLLAECALQHLPRDHLVSLRRSDCGGAESESQIQIQIESESESESEREGRSRGTGEPLPNVRIGESG